MHLAEDDRRPAPQDDDFDPDPRYPFDFGPPRSPKVMNPEASLDGYHWYCLPPPKRPDQLPRPAADSTPVWEPLTEVAQRLRISPNTLYNRVKNKTLEARTEERTRSDGKHVKVLLVRPADCAPAHRRHNSRANDSARVVRERTT